jgi:hypothetical protein
LEADLVIGQRDNLTSRELVVGHGKLSQEARNTLQPIFRSAPSVRIRA